LAAAYLSERMKPSNGMHRHRGFLRNNNSGGKEYGQVGYCGAGDGAAMLISKRILMIRLAHGDKMS